MAFRLLVPALCALAATLNVHANPVVPSAPSAINNPASFVPPTRYRSVFADTPTGVEQDSLDWKKANADVGQFRNGFADILQWEAAQEALKNPGAAPAAPAAPVHKH
ncbi:MAG: hypothetical protein V4562_09600 [Pseudomonadota bacterium]